jgi:hypothetical protein
VPDLAIDLDALEAMKRELTSISSEFSRAEEISGALAEAVGHRQLAATVEDFARAWSVHRAELLTGITFVLDAATAIHDTFEELDRRLTVQAEKLDDYLAPVTPASGDGGAH